MRFHLLHLFFFFALRIQAQNYLWTDTLQFEDDRSITSMMEDEEENIYTAAVSNVTGTYLLSSYYCGNIHLRKYNSDGSILWEKILSGKARIFDIEIDGSGNIIVGGAYTQLLQVDGENFNTPAFMAGLFLIKLNSDGIIIWTVAEEPTFSSSLITSIATDSDNNIYATGLKDDVTALLRKYNQDGEEIYDEELVDVRTTSDIKLDEEGNIYICGSCSAYAEFDGLEIPEEATLTGYVNYFAKYNSAFEAQSIYALSYFTFDFNASLAKNSSGIFWRCTYSPSGTFEYHNTTLFYHTSLSTLDTIRSINYGFDFPSNFIARAGEDVVLLDNFDFSNGVIKLNTEGEILDSLELPGTNQELETFACNADNIWIGGYLYDLISLDTFLVEIEDGDFYQPFVARYGVEELDTLICNSVFTYVEFGSAYNFICTSIGSIVSYAWTFGDGGSSIEVNPMYVYEEPGEYEVCLTITWADGCIDSKCDTIIVGTPDLNQDFSMNEIQIFPNPFIDVFQIQLQPNNSILRIKNIKGESIPFNTINQNDFNFEVHLIDAHSGIYFIEISDGEHGYWKKIVAY